MSVGCLDATGHLHAVTTLKHIVRRHIRDGAVAIVMLLPSTRRAPTTIQGSEDSYHLMDSRSGFQNLAAPGLKLSFDNHELSMNKVQGLILPHIKRTKVSIFNRPPSSQLVSFQ